MGSCSSKPKPCDSTIVIDKLECMKSFYELEECTYQTNYSNDMEMEMTKKGFANVNMKQLIIDFELKYNRSGKKLNGLENLYILIVQKYEDDMKLANCDCKESCVIKIDTKLYKIKF